MSFLWKTVEKFDLKGGLVHRCGLIHDGFDVYLNKVQALEKPLGTYDLNQFTPK